MLNILRLTAIPTLGQNQYVSTDCDPEVLDIVDNSNMPQSDNRDQPDSTVVSAELDLIMNDVSGKWSCKSCTKEMLFIFFLSLFSFFF